MHIEKVRDLTLVNLGQGKTMVIACDSCGSVGLKQHDALRVSPFITGKFTARVVILEILCAGAEMICLTNTICNEMSPTGKEIIRGIEEELRDAGIGRIVLTGSTEENFPTYTTGLGITAVGLAENTNLKVNSIKDNALLIALGQPKVGQAVLRSKKGDIVDYNMIKKLLALANVYEMTPVGSKGILYEARQLAHNNKLKLLLNDDIKINIHQSAGPSTVVLAAIGNHSINRIGIPGSVEVIGRLALPDDASQ